MNISVSRIREAAARFRLDHRTLERYARGEPVRPLAAERCSEAMAYLRAGEGGLRQIAADLISASTVFMNALEIAAAAMREADLNDPAKTIERVRGMHRIFHGQLDAAVARVGSGGLPGVY